MKWLLAIALVACGARQAPLPPPPPPVTVLDTGAEPRRLVRYTLQPHAHTRLETDTDVTVTERFTNTVLENGANRVAFPRVRVIETIEVTAREPDGSARVNTQIEQATAESQLANPRAERAFETVLARLRKMHSTRHVAPSGAVTNVVIDSAEPRGANATVEYAAQQTAMVFPDVPIGVGGAWKSVTHVTTGGVEWQRTTTYHLRALDDVSASIEYEAAMSASEHVLYTEPNASTKVTSGDGVESGQVLVNLGDASAIGGWHATLTVNMLIVDHALRISSTLQNETSETIQPAP
jgi:Family of unknown function (DUF6263)